MRSRVLLVLVALVGCALCLSCHDDVNPGALTPAFTAGSAPEDNSITLQPVSVDGDLITIAVYAQAVPDLYGVTFDVTYDKDMLFFLDTLLDGTDSILVEGLTDPDAQSSFQTLGSLGSYNVFATRTDFELGGVNTDGPVVLLRFRALAATTGTAIHLENFVFYSCQPLTTGEACDVEYTEADLDLLDGGTAVITGP